MGEIFERLSVENRLGFSLGSVHPEMIDFGSEQGLSDCETVLLHLPVMKLVLMRYLDFF